MEAIADIAEIVPRPEEPASLPERPTPLATLLGSDMTQGLATIALYSALAVVFIRAFYIIDPDIWWHLRTGKWILEHFAVPVTDPFSTYGIDKPWVAYSWLFDTGIAAVFDRWGMVGIAAYEIAIRLALSVALFHLVR